MSGAVVKTDMLAKPMAKELDRELNVGNVKPQEAIHHKTNDLDNKVYTISQQLINQLASDDANKAQLALNALSDLHTYVKSWFQDVRDIDPLVANKEVQLNQWMIGILTKNTRVWLLCMGEVSGQQIFSICHINA